LRRAAVSRSGGSVGARRRFLARERAESGEVFSTHGRATWFDQEQITDELKHSAIDHVLIDTDQPFVHRLRHFFRFRGVFGRGTR
jgi:hypothetical protein